MLYSLVLALLFSLAISVPLEPGQAGGPWTKEEIDIVRAKVIFKNSFEGHFNPGLFNPKLQPQTFQPRTFQP